VIRGKMLAVACFAGAGFAASVALSSAATTATTTTSTTAKTTTTVSAAPSNMSAPAISGTARDGSLLTVSTGKWTGSPTSYEFQWLRCDADGANCSTIAGADSQRYTATSADVGHRLRADVSAGNSAGTGSARSEPTGVVQAAGNVPVNKSLPTISGNAQQDSVLTVDNGSWSGTQPISYAYAWQRCDAQGGNCSTIGGSTSSKYTIVAADVGHTIRAQVTATNARGSSTATSQQTALVAPAKTTQGTTVVSVAQVSLPDRLVIDRVRFSPNPVTSRRTSIVARFHVSDTRGLSVQGALVYTIGLPYGWTFNAAEQPTDTHGWATILIHPTPNMPLRRGDLVMFVRARKPGDNLLAGVSTRRLVQEGIR
jgi:Ig domain of plant-specific actin-binding protein